MLNLTDERGTAIECEPERFVIAGYTGRDRAQVQHHIDELAREGIAPPPEVPMWFEMPLALLTTARTIDVPTAETSGECEPVLIGDGEALYLGIGSDHTARDVEREDVAKSKRICPKPIGPNVVRVAAFDQRFDAIAIESRIDDERYQLGTFAQIMPLDELLALLRARIATKHFVMFCGTVPLLTGGFRFGKRFSAQLSGGALAAPLVLTYDAVAP